MAGKNQVAYKVDLKRPENQNSLDNLLGNMPKKKITRCSRSKTGKSLEHTDTVVCKEERASLVKNNLTSTLTATGFVFTYSRKVLINKTATSTGHRLFYQRAAKMDAYGVLVAVMSPSVQS